MTIKINIKCGEITKDELFEIYTLFREAYEVRENKWDKNYFFDRGIALIRAGGIIDYRPFLGGKFFAQCTSGGIQVWGYTKDDPQKREESKFEKLLISHFG